MKKYRFGAGKMKRLAKIRKNLQTKIANNSLTKQDQASLIAISLGQF